MTLADNTLIVQEVAPRDGLQIETDLRLDRGQNCVDRRALRCRVLAHRGLLVRLPEGRTGPARRARKSSQTSSGAPARSTWRWCRT